MVLAPPHPTPHPPHFWNGTAFCEKFPQIICYLYTLPESVWLTPAFDSTSLFDFVSNFDFASRCFLISDSWRRFEKLSRGALGLSLRAGFRV